MVKKTIWTERCMSDNFDYNSLYYNMPFWQSFILWGMASSKYVCMEYGHGYLLHLQWLKNIESQTQFNIQMGF